MRKGERKLGENRGSLREKGRTKKKKGPTQEKTRWTYRRTEENGRDRRRRAVKAKESTTLEPLASIANI